MAKPKITTIKITNETKTRLDHLKEHEKESYEETIKKALNILNITKRSPMLGARIMRDIERGKKRINLLDNPEKIIRRKPVVRTPLQTMEMNIKSLQRQPTQRPPVQNMRRQISVRRI